MTQPEWATNFILLVARDEGKNAPKVAWRKMHRNSSSGFCYYKITRGIKIKMKCGDDIHDAKQVLLHELAHWLTPKGHTIRFWEKYWKMFNQYQNFLCLDLEKCKTRSFNYKGKAKLAYDQMLASS